MAIEFQNPVMVIDVNGFKMCVFKDSLGASVQAAGVSIPLSSFDFDVLCDDSSEYYDSTVAINAKLLVDELSERVYNSSCYRSTFD